MHTQLTGDFMRDFIVAAVLSTIASMALAQTPIQGPASQLAPAPTVQLVQSPEILPDGRVTFRLAAPDALKVEVRGNFPSGFEPSIVPMTKDANGVWSVTVGPLKPEFRFYNFYVDGAPVVDPRNPHTRRDGLQMASTLIVPGAESSLLAVNDVPHGTLAQVWYDSPALKMKRRVYIYTPPGYEVGNRRYPVLYLLHGGGGDEDAWTSNGRAPQIFDNLIASGRMQPMLVIMPNGNANQSASQDYVTQPAQPLGNAGTIFADSVVSDLIPFVDKTYRTSTDRNNRAIAGLSMGGGQTLWTAFNNLDHFAWVAGFSGAYHNVPGARITIPPPPNVADLREPGITQSFDPDKLFAALPDLNPAANNRLKLFLVTIGSHDGLLTQQRLLKSTLDAKGIHLTAKEVPGYMHEWAFWRVALIDLMPQLFQPTR